MVVESQNTESTEVEVLITVSASVADGKCARTSADELVPHHATSQPSGVCSCKLWLLFALGWLFPPCWWLGAWLGLAGSACRCSTQHKVACLASCVMTLTSTVVLVVVLPAYFSHIRGEPHKYYFTLQGPIKFSRGLLEANSKHLAVVFHAAFDLPASYPASHIVTWRVSAPVTSRHLLASEQLVIGLQLHSVGVTQAAVIGKLVKSGDGATAILLQFVVSSMIDPAAVGQLTALFTDSLGDTQRSQVIEGGGTSVDKSEEVLQYPALPLKADSCTWRIRFDKSRIAMNCHSPWESLAGTSQIPPALEIDRGVLVEQLSRKPAALHGVNWFGWGTGANFDGLWAYCDDNSTYSSPPCEQDGEVPLNISWWGKRRMTNDFAAVVHRMKLLGFNAVRVQFRFDRLVKELPYSSTDPEFFLCLLDSDDFIGLRTLDPQLLAHARDHNNSTDIMQHLPQYHGMPHPPPHSGNAQCDSMPWSEQVSIDDGGRAGNFNLTMCNWYLPQGPGVQGLHRFLWQLQYLISQGFYVLLDFSNTRDREVNVQNPQLLAQNWGNLWRILTDIPDYKEYMAGRIFPDLVNEPSRWGCQWDESCHEANGSRACAPILHSFGLTAAAIWKADPMVPIFMNGLGQDSSKPSSRCGRSYPGMHWGDGFITSEAAVNKVGMGSASKLMKTANKLPGPGFVLAPHLYPGSVTTDNNTTTQNPVNIAERWDLSWGLKAQGLDVDDQGYQLPTIPVVIGEFGARDLGNNSVSNTDSTQWSQADRGWFQATGAYLGRLAENTGRPVSWFFWAWNANSGDTQGIMGPLTTWREVQWTKVRMLSQILGLRPWYCKMQPHFCETVQW